MKKSLDLLRLEAAANLHKLSLNPYVGRGIVIGLDDMGENLVQVYWIMGRSENSRNRIFVAGGNGLLSTEAADPSKVKDPSLIIYNAMVEGFCIDKSFAIVSNGKQTDAVASDYTLGRRFEATLENFAYEPDDPNFTPRITAFSRWRKEQPVAMMSILRKSLWSDECDRHFYKYYDLGKGFGHGITTYLCDGDPLPSFEGEPILLPLYGDAAVIAHTYWAGLDPENRVSLAVKFIPKDGPSKIVIINKYQKV